MHVRAFPGWERLRTELAAALGVPVSEVRGLTEPADPVVRVDANAGVVGFQLTVDLFIDPRRLAPPALPGLAARLARQLDLDVAYHAGSLVAFEYVLQRADGKRFIAVEHAEDDSDGLLLDEAPDRLRPLS